MARKLSPPLVAVTCTLIHGTDQKIALQGDPKQTDIFEMAAILLCMSQLM